ncbi:DUF1217 domain-containing protein [Vannielia litorea]|uniref:DUF1217 domain-containing protein n=1 Tax=Vannielia litorea TaxID=1217970 RepID=UPI001BCFAAB7|nr:DUF1217 domain-containing protein [Vannielia litorea]MBS8226146.1 DUF1217 domain-containing protein [Vannielia litorea]
MFTPIVPLGGLLGWQFLQRTQESQQQTLASSTTVQRDMAEFEERIASVKTPEDLVSDFRLLRIALGAFGLADDIGNKYFIQKVLEEGTAEGSLASRLSDTRYRDLAEAFGFGTYDTPNNAFGAIEAQIRAGTDTLPAREREAAGDRALTLVDRLKQLSDLTGQEDVAPEQAALRAEVEDLWPQVMGQPRMREAMRATFDIGEGYDALNHATQVEVLRQKVVGLFEDRPAEQLTGFIDRIKQGYTTRQFEQAVGEQAQELRIALNLERELPDLAADPDDANDTMWFKIMGSSPLRAVFDAAFGLPTAFSALDIDRQLDVYKERAQSLFGSSEVSQFTDPAKREDLIRTYLVRTEISGQASTGGGSSAALTILSNVSSNNLFSLLT